MSKLMFMMMFFLGLLFYAKCQLSCDDSNVLCVGDDVGDYNLTSAIAMVTGGSDYKYILLKRDVLADDEGEDFPIHIGPSNDPGTKESPITIMPHPDNAGIVKLSFNSDPDNNGIWIIIEQDYWRITGGDEKKLKLLFDGGENEGKGMVNIRGKGKFKVDNVIVESYIDSCDYIIMFGVSCYSGCDDENFDDVFIENVDFVAMCTISSNDGCGKGVKIDINSTSWSTTKFTMKGCTFDSELGFDTDGKYWNAGIRMSASGYEIQGTFAGSCKYGCQNCEISDNEFLAVYNPLHIDVGQDISVHDNTFVVPDGLSMDRGEYSGIITPFFWGGSDQGCTDTVLKNFHFYDNEVTFESTTSGGYFLSFGNYLASLPPENLWIDNMVIENNVLDGLPGLVKKAADYPGGTDVTFDGNTITYAADYDVPLLSYDCSGLGVNNPNDAVKLVNNHIEWDLGTIGATENTTWIYSDGCDLKVEAYYNYFSFVEDEDYSVYTLSGVSTTNNAFSEVTFYGNVFDHEHSVIDFAVSDDTPPRRAASGTRRIAPHGPFGDICTSLEVTNNLFSTMFLFDDDTYVTAEDNVVSEDMSAYNVEDPCETDYFVPYDGDYTPETDIDGVDRATSGNTWIGPKTCYGDDDGDVFEAGSFTLTVLFYLVGFILLF